MPVINDFHLKLERVVILRLVDRTLSNASRVATRGCGYIVVGNSQTIVLSGRVVILDFS